MNNLVTTLGNLSDVEENEPQEAGDMYRFPNMFDESSQKYLFN